MIKRDLIIGILIGTMLGGSVAWAASKMIRFQTSDGLAVTSSNPLPIQSY